MTTVVDWLERRAGENATASFLFHADGSYTYADVLERADRFAVGLAERGVGRGDRVVVIADNAPEVLFTWFGACWLGAIFAPLNPALKPAEIDAYAALVEPRVILRADDLAPLSGAGRGAPRADVSPDDVGVLIATSGTTGAPKAVAQTHRTYALTAEAFPSWVGIGASDRLLAALPLFHINAQAYSVMGALGAGASLALAPKFSASRFFENAARLGATHFNAVGAMINILLETLPSPSDRAHGLRGCYAALALPEARHRAFEERFGIRMTVGYGMSETTFGTVWPLGEHPYGTMGRLRQHPTLGDINHARVVRDDGNDASEGEAGELWLQNPATMREYWRAPEETARALAGEWLHTGDVVRRDATGLFTFVSRKKEMIRRRGENIAAAEIENALLAHPSVREAAAIGVPSPLGEDDIVAYVTLRAPVDVDALRAFVRERIADYKVPATIHVRESLPKTATQRIAKSLL